MAAASAAVLRGSSFSPRSGAFIRPTDRLGRRSGVAPSSCSAPLSEFVSPSELSCCRFGLPPFFSLRLRVSGGAALPFDRPSCSARHSGLVSPSELSCCRFGLPPFFSLRLRVSGGAALSFDCPSCSARHLGLVSPSELSCCRFGLRPFLSGGASIVQQKIPGSGIRTSLCFRPFSAASCSPAPVPLSLAFCHPPFAACPLAFLMSAVFPVVARPNCAPHDCDGGRCASVGYVPLQSRVRSYRSVSNPARRRMSSALRTVPRSQRSTSSRCSRPASRQPPAPARIRSESR